MVYLFIYFFQFSKRCIRMIFQIGGDMRFVEKQTVCAGPDLLTRGGAVDPFAEGFVMTGVKRAVTKITGLAGEVTGIIGTVLLLPFKPAVTVVS